MAMLGGINSTPGILAGALLVTSLPEILRNVSSNMIMLVYGILVILLMIFMPMGLGGIFGKIAKKYDVLFHSDAAQAIGKIDIDVKKFGIDLLSISGHKIYGPKGIGALYVSTSPKRIRLVPLFSGGGQERNFRSGTLPVPLCVGIGEAIKISQSEMQQDNENALNLRNLFLEILCKNLKGVHVNGSLEHRVPQNLNLAFEGIESESLIFALEDIALTSVSACSSEKLESSYVLHAIGVPDELSHASFRISFGRFSTKDEVIYTADKIIKVVNNLRSISPLWNN